MKKMTSTSRTAHTRQEETMETVAKALQVEKIPLFYGDTAKDSIDGATFLMRVENNREVNKWNDEDTCLNMKNACRGVASIWIEELNKVRAKNWTDWKKRFRYEFVPQVQTDKTFNALKTLKQKKNETPGIFCARVTIH